MNLNSLFERRIHVFAHHQLKGVNKRYGLLGNKDENWKHSLGHERLGFGEKPMKKLLFKTIIDITLSISKDKILKKKEVFPLSVTDRMVVFNQMLSVTTHIKLCRIREKCQIQHMCPKLNLSFRIIVQKITYLKGRERQTGGQRVPIPHTNCLPELVLLHAVFKPSLPHGWSQLLETSLTVRQNQELDSGSESKHSNIDHIFQMTYQYYRKLMSPEKNFDICVCVCTPNINLSRLTLKKKIVIVEFTICTQYLVADLINCQDNQLFAFK